MTTASNNRGLCRHDGHTISAHIQIPRRPEIGDCPGFDPKPTKTADAQRTQTAQVMFGVNGTLHVVAARSEADFSGPARGERRSAGLGRL